ncbi:hypothetical protein FDENT_991 [Fusarium denticulatum]|uniref:Uncharacterized protein n=1 Tax=Fusarium denticulatum TaxID=48507 RepID=A0A8H5XK00_9HYPO|nr:hypothetical protein FDENT_991 [Fusarium denticulatum]
MSGDRSGLLTPELDQLSGKEKAQPHEDFGKKVRAIWKRASYTPPPKIQEILRAQQSWGFVYYEAKEVEHPYDRRWNSLLDIVNYTPQPSLARDVREATYSGIHCQGKRNDLVALQTEIWAPVTSERDLDEDDGFRRHFQEFRQSLSSPGILKSSFIDSFTEETACSNCERYQGRVKVVVYSLNMWFYAVRWEGVSLRDMCLKAQMHQDKLWICYEKEMED